MNNDGFGRVSTSGGGGASIAGLVSDNQVGSGQVGSAQAAGAGGGASGGNAGGAAAAAGGVSPIGGDTAENQYANSRLSAAKVVIRQHPRDSTILHNKVQYAQPNNISQIVSNVKSNNINK